MAHVVLLLASALVGTLGSKPEGNSGPDARLHNAAAHAHSAHKSPAVHFPASPPKKEEEDEALIQTQHYNNCPYYYMSHARKMTQDQYDNMGIDFTNATLELNSQDPHNPTTIQVPGCLRARIHNVQFSTRKYQNLIAEFAIRVGKTPIGIAPVSYSMVKSDPSAIPCARDGSGCNCGDSGNSCLRCGFCSSLLRTANGAKLRYDGRRKGRKAQKGVGGLGGRCDCPSGFEPTASYTIDTEICTPDLDSLDAASKGNDVLELLGAGETIPMWATIYLYDSEAGYAEKFFLGQQMEDRAMAHRNERTVGCFLMSFQAKIKLE